MSHETYINLYFLIFLAFLVAMICLWVSHEREWQQFQSEQAYFRARHPTLFIDHDKVK